MEVLYIIGIILCFVCYTIISVTYIRLAIIVEMPILLILFALVVFVFVRNLIKILKGKKESKYFKTKVTLAGFIGIILCIVILNILSNYI